MNARLLPILLLGATAVGCGKKSERDAYAVGGFVGTGSIFGTTRCTYTTTPATGVADLDADKTVGQLIGEGVVVEKCPKVTLTFDVRKPTGAIITGASTIKIGAPHELYRAVPVDGKRELHSSGHFQASWKLGDDCAASATTEGDDSAQDTGGSTYTMFVTGKAAGTCTLTSTVLGLTATRTITIK
jgi:hypothetical protein